MTHSRGQKNETSKRPAARPVQRVRTLTRQRPRRPQSDSCCHVLQACSQLTINSIHIAAGRTSKPHWQHVCVSSRIVPSSPRTARLIISRRPKQGQDRPHPPGGEWAHRRFEVVVTGKDEGRTARFRWCDAQIVVLSFIIRPPSRRSSHFIRIGPSTKGEGSMDKVTR